MSWTIVRRFPDWEAARSFAACMVASEGQGGWQEVSRSPSSHIVRVEEHSSGIGVIYYRNGDADVYRGRFLPAWDE